MSEEFEELEQIPWAALAATSPSPRNRYLGVAAAVALIVVAAVWVMVRDDSAAAVSLYQPAARVEPANELTTATAPVSTASVYSEADLMLIDAADEERLAVMQAEWLVRDLLTVDDDPLIVERIHNLLPDIERSDAPAYVEWAEAFSVESPHPGRYRIEVAYRILTGTESGYVRQPAGALAVEVAIDVDGSASLIAGPEPVSLPELAGPPD